jgi:hypothetical protein
VADEAPSEEQLRERLEQELRRLKVEDLLVQTATTVSSLAYGKLSGEGRDLDQARLAIDALRALVPVLEGTVPPEVVRDLNQVKANLQLAYAEAVAAPQEASQEAPQETPQEDEAGGS